MALIFFQLYCVCLAPSHIMCDMYWFLTGLFVFFSFFWVSCCCCCCLPASSLYFYDRQGKLFHAPLLSFVQSCQGPAGYEHRERSKHTHTPHQTLPSLFSLTPLLLWRCCFIQSSRCVCFIIMRCLPILLHNKGRSMCVGVGVCCAYAAWSSGVDEYAVSTSARWE